MKPPMQVTRPSFQSVGIKDMYHNAWLHWLILTESRFIGDKSLSRSVRNYSDEVV